MAENIKRHITHIKSKVANQKPTSSQLLEGEVAVNYAKDKEFLSIKNESGDVVTFSSDNYYTEQKLGSGFTGSNSGNTVTKVIEDNEKVISSALNALNEVVSNLDETYVTLDTNQTISGKKTFSETVNIEDDMNVTGTARFNGDAKIDGHLYASDMNVDGRANFQNNVDVYSNEYINGTLTVNGTTNLQGKTFANGGLDMNDNDINNVQSITINGTTRTKDNLETHNIKPMTGDTYNIGTKSSDPTKNKYYKTIYVRNVNDIPVSDFAQTDALAFKKISATTNVGLVNSLSQYYDTNIGKGAVIEGEGTSTAKIKASGNYSHAEGYVTTASGTYSHAEGQSTTASGNWSHAEGASTKASGTYSHAEGSGTTASDYSHAEGYKTTASGTYSHAEGASTIANGNYSHAEGDTTTASGASSHAEGYSTKASGSYSHAEGQGTTASGNYSHAEGQGTTASGNYSHAEGNRTITNNSSEHASGQYNVSSKVSTTFGNSGNTLFSVGNGTSTSNRHNAFEIRQNGDIYIVKDNTDVKLQDAIPPVVELTNYMTTSSTLPVDDNTIYTYNGKVVEKRLGHNGGGDDIIAFATFRDVDGLQMDDISVLKYSKGSSESSYKYNGNFNLSTNTGDTIVQELRSMFGVHNATVATDGLMSANDKKKLDGSVEYIYVTYSELKALKQQNGLRDGTKYRIEDFVTTTTQANTQSANHPFDLIVTATGRNTLNETAMAAKRANDTYFSGSNLSAWDIKYCFENDTNRFGWADPTNGKGVIYYMKDEFSNEAPYDFKNIQFKRWKCTSVSATTSGVPESLLESMEDVFVDHYHLHTSSSYTINSIKVTPNTSDSKFFYTFSLCGNGEEDDSKTVIDGSLKAYGEDMYKNNVIREYMPTDDSTYYMLNNIVFKPIKDDTYDDCTCNVFGKNCREMTLGFAWMIYNSFGNGCYNYYFGNGCGNNSFGNRCESNYFGNDCNNNSFGNSCFSNSFGYNCGSNSFENDCNSNSFGNSCGNNSFGNNCNNNSFGDECNSNSFENDCNSNSFGNSCGNNSFGNWCSGNTTQDVFEYNSFGNKCCNNSMENDNSGMFFGNNCRNNSIDDGCYNITLGDSCQFITFNDDNGVSNVNVEGGNRYITLNSSGGNNITIAQGVNNSTTRKTISHTNRTGKTTYQNSNSTVINV